MNSIQHIEQFDLLAAELIQLSNEIVQAQLDSRDFSKVEVLQRAAALFAGLHAVSRNSVGWVRDNKFNTAIERKIMDENHLSLQNLLFERNHLEKEIRKCETFDSEYSTLTIHSIEELETLAMEDNSLSGLPNPLPTDSHELMLARLNFELFERQRFEEERKVLGAEKSKLVKENELKKTRLEDLEKQLDDFVVSAKEIQSKMETNSF